MKNDAKITTMTQNLKTTQNKDKMHYKITIFGACAHQNPGPGHDCVINISKYHVFAPMGRFQLKLIYMEERWKIKVN